MSETKTFQTFRDFCDYFGVEPARLPRAIYKGTACGASITFHMADGGKTYEGHEGLAALTPDSPVISVAVGSIVEGSDVEVSPRDLDFPFTAAQWEEAVEAVEEEADFYWRRDNLDHFLVTRPGVMRVPVAEGVDAGWGILDFHGQLGSPHSLTPGERLAAGRAIQHWQDEDKGPQPGQSRKVGDLTIECYSQDDFFFD